MNNTMPYTFVRYKSIILQPHWLQWIVQEMPVMLMTLAAIFLAGLENFPFRTLWTVLSGILILRLLYSLVYMRKIEYRIDTSQLIYEHGIFVRRREYMELYRITDFREQRNFMEQIFGLKKIRILSGDRTMPVLDIIGIPNRFDLVTKLRERVVYNRLRNGVYEITNR